MNNLLEINQKQYEQLKRNYLDAINNNRDKFFIDGQPILTKFAQYWLQLIEDNRKSRGERIYEPNKHDQTCKKCGFVWTSRVDNPRTCPNCKNRRKI